MSILEPGRHKRSFPASMPRDGIARDIRRLKALADDAREQAFLAEETLPNAREVKSHCRQAGTLIGQILQDLADLARRPA